MQTKWTIDLLADLFTQSGHMLLATKYINAKEKYAYQCKCGNTQCFITIGHLKEGKNNCKICAKEKRITTNLEKYGCEHPSQNAEIREKIAATNLAKFGCENPLQNIQIKEKFKATSLEKYGCENPMQNAQIQEKIKATNLERYGCENPSQNAQVQQKIKATNLEKYGCECSLQNAQVQEKIKSTNLEKYGCENPLQNAQIQANIKIGNLEKFGCEYPAQNAQVRENMKATNLERYGCENPFQNIEVQDKIKATNLEKYGCENPMQNAQIQEKFKTTNQEKYGCEYPMQNAEVFALQQKSAFKRKPYIFASGQQISVQGYEAFALDLLLSQGVEEADLLLGFSTMPHIMYKHDSNTHRYYPDIFVPSQNKIVEVKSEYTYEANFEITHLKMQACQTQGLSAEIWIFLANGTLSRIISDFVVSANSSTDNRAIKI
jgi:hypothetical protein